MKRRGCITAKLLASMLSRAGTHMYMYIHVGYTVEPLLMDTPYKGHNRKHLHNYKVQV